MIQIRGRRRRTLCLALTFVAVISAAGWAGSSQSSAATTRLVSFQMVSPTVGWGTTSQAVVKTADGGRHWRGVLYDAHASFGVDTAKLSTLGSEDGWVATITGLHSFAVRFTSNGGRSWHKVRHVVGGKLSLVQGILSFNFIDVRHGWLLTVGNGAAGSIGHDLFRTSDGGLSWTRVEFNHIANHSPGSLPACDGSVNAVSFENPKDGWATGMCGAATQLKEIFRTTDGGRTWRHHPITVPSQLRPAQVFEPMVPTFTGTQGVLPVVTNRGFVLYDTENGHTWRPTKPIRNGGSMQSSAASFFALNARDVWSYCPATSMMAGHRSLIRYTSDGGMMWVTYMLSANSLMTLGRFVQLDFVSPSVGFAVSGAGDFTTTNGGRSWHRLHPVFGMLK